MRENRIGAKEGRYKKEKRGSLGISSQTERLYDRQQRGTYQRIEGTWRLQGDCVFRGNAFLEGSGTI